MKCVKKEIKGSLKLICNSIMHFFTGSPRYKLRSARWIHVCCRVYSPIRCIRVYRVRGKLPVLCVNCQRRK